MRRVFMTALILAISLPQPAAPAPEDEGPAVPAAGLDEAAKRVHPDETRRREVMSPAAELRDLVRQEVWREFR
jgi:hypothetical protein